MEDKKNLPSRRGVIKNAGIAVLGVGTGSLISSNNAAAQSDISSIRIEQDGTITRSLNIKLGDVV
jgi:hypothetical protein